MGGAGSTHRRDEKFTQFQPGNMMERDHLKDLDMDGKAIFKCIIKKM